MSLAGTYEYASNENYSEWLSAVGEFLLDVGGVLFLSYFVFRDSLGCRT